MTGGCLPWPEEKLTQFRALWDQGCSFSIIGTAMGITRSAAIGKAWRLGLRRLEPANHVTPRAPPKPRLVVPRQPRLLFLPEEPLPAEPEPMPENAVTFADLAEHQCRYPVDINDQRWFCGAARLESFPYCLRHFRLCYTTPPSRHSRDQAAKAKAQAFLALINPSARA